MQPAFQNNVHCQVARNAAMEKLTAEDRLMFARMWRGWTTRENSKAYEDVFREVVLTEVNAVDGFKGAYLLRRDINEETEFIVLTLFKSMKAVQEFAGEDYELAVVSSEAKAVLMNFEECATHFEVVIGPK
jgi:heme-degrading monooxygenase HmoA